MKLNIDREKAKRKPFIVDVFKMIYPSESTCGICGLPWSACQPSHVTPTSKGHGCFPVCEYCWETSDRDTLQKAYLGLYTKWCESGHAPSMSPCEFLGYFDKDWLEWKKSIAPEQSQAAEEDYSSFIKDKLTVKEIKPTITYGNIKLDDFINRMKKICDDNTEIRDEVADILAKAGIKTIKGSYREVGDDIDITINGGSRVGKGDVGFMLRANTYTIRQLRKDIKELIEIYQRANNEEISEIDVRNVKNMLTDRDEIKLIIRTKLK